MKNSFLVMLMMFVSFYANAQQWVKLNKHVDVTSDDVCLIVDVISGYALSSKLNGSDRPKAVKVSLVDTIIMDDESITEDLKWTFKKYSGGYIIRTYSNSSNKLIENSGLTVSSSSTYDTTWLLGESKPPYYGIRTSTVSRYLWWRQTSDTNIYWNAYSSNFPSQSIQLFKYVPAPAVQTPILSEQAGIYTEPFTLELSAENGAEIYYTLDGSVPDENSLKYSVGINIHETTIIKAVAIKNGEKSDILSAQYYFATSLNTIKEFNETANQNYVSLKLDRVQVTAVNGDEIFIQDATGGMMLYHSGLSLNIGDVLSGSIRGQKTTMEGIPMIDSENYTTLEKNESASLEPTAISIEDLITDTSNKFAFRLVKLINVELKDGFLVQKETGEKLPFIDYFSVLSGEETYPPLMDVTGLWMSGEKYYGLSIRSYADIENVSGLEQPDFYWSTTQFTADLSATDIVFPVLNNNSDGQVTYNSSNAAVANIDAYGRIMLISEGTTVISAVVSASLNYLSARTEYKLTVTNVNGVQKPQAYVAKDEDQYYAMGNTHNTGTERLDAYKVQVLNGCVVNTLNDKTILTWYVDKEKGTIKNAQGLYVTYGGDETSLTLKSSKYTWAWDVENGYWYDKETKRIIDLSRDKTYFRCYQTSKFSPRFMPIVDGYGRDVTEGRFGTICLPYNVESGNFEGATFHRISGKRMNNEGLQPTELVLSAPVKELEAGEPYVFLPTSAQVILVYGNESADQAKENNGLIGTFDGINSDNSAPEALRGMYLFSDNKLKKSGSGGKISKNRAYVDMSKVPVLDAAAEVNGLYFSLDDGSVTVVSEYNRDEEDRKYDVYSLSGVLVRQNVREDKALEGLPAGIYLLNGKKYLVK